MAQHTATATDLIGETLTEVEQLVDIWSALADTKHYKRLLQAAFWILKEHTKELPDSIWLLVEYCDRLVAIRAKFEPLGQYSSSDMDKILLSLIGRAISSFAEQHGKLVHGLQRLAAWKRKLTDIPNWNMDGQIWDDWVQQLVDKLIREKEKNMVDQACILLLSSLHCLILGTEKCNIRI